jgi:hypothetical protein
MRKRAMNVFNTKSNYSIKLSYKASPNDENINDYFALIKEYVSDDITEDELKSNLAYDSKLRDLIQLGSVSETHNSDLLLKIIEKAFERNDYWIWETILSHSSLVRNSSPYDIGEKTVNYIISLIDGTEMGENTAKKMSSIYILKSNKINSQLIEFMAKNYWRFKIF